MSQSNRVVITGIGIVSPVGNNREEAWNAVLKGVSGVSKISSFDASEFPCSIGGQVKGFSINDRLSSYGHLKLSKYISRGTSFGIGASYEAMADAGLLERGVVANSRVGVSIGNSGQRPFLSQWKDILSAHQNNFAEMPYIDMSTYLKNKYHTCSELISIIHGAKGPNYSVSTACASGTQAIGMAYREIQEGNADVMIAGGCDSMLNEIDLMSFCLLGAVTTSFNDSPEKASCPFSHSRSGFVLGEGGAILILERLEHVLKRKGKIYAEIIGYGHTMSAYSMTDIPPNGFAAASSMEAALNDAGIKKEEVDYINAHGTSTVDNDMLETLSIKKIFGDYAKKVPISSTKSTTSHLISGAGAIEAAFCALSIRDAILPPTINLMKKDGKCDLDYIPNKKRYCPVNITLSNSLGFGGTNASVIMKRFLN